MMKYNLNNNFSEEEKAFRRIVDNHIIRYPKMEVQDLCKLIYQSVMGSGHAVSDLESVRAWMLKEVANLGEGPEEPVVDPISADKRIMRIHLRPYMAKKGDPEKLLKAFIQTANEYKGTIEDLKRIWAYAVHMADKGDFLFTKTDLVHFFDNMAEKGYPAAHHSAIYRRSYKPAYRVILYDYYTGTE